MSHVETRTITLDGKHYELISSSQDHEFGRMYFLRDNAGKTAILLLSIAADRGWSLMEVVPRRVGNGWAEVPSSSQASAITIVVE
jgi:hypothetical protein